MLFASNFCRILLPQKFKIFALFLGKKLQFLPGHFWLAIRAKKLVTSRQFWGLTSRAGARAYSIIYKFYNYFSKLIDTKLLEC